MSKRKRDDEPSPPPKPSKSPTPTLPERASFLGLPRELHDEIWEIALDLDDTLVRKVSLIYYGLNHFHNRQDQCRDWLQTFLPGMDMLCKFRLELSLTPGHHETLVAKKHVLWTAERYVETIGSSIEVEVAFWFPGADGLQALTLRELEAEGEKYVQKLGPDIVLGRTELLQS